MVSYNFEGRVAFVMGGTSGIGLATAEAFARAGAKIAVGARNAEGADAARAALAGAGADALFVNVDVRDEQSVADCVDRVVGHFGRLDFAVNSAGHGGDMKPVPDTDQAVWDEVMAVNARGVWLAMRYQIAAMMASGGGSIVNLCSIYGLVGHSAHHAYVASKHAVLGMTRSVGLEYAKQGIRVNAICAGFTRTPAMQGIEEAMPELVAGITANIPAGRMASVSEIAGSALWLCADDAGYSVGAPLIVDGGYLAA